MKKKVNIKATIYTDGEFCSDDCTYITYIDGYFCSLFRRGVENYFEVGKLKRCRACLNAERKVTK